MNIKTFKLVDWTEMLADFTKLTGLQVNTLGIWNSPPERHVVIANIGCNDFPGYYSGESKNLIFHHTDKPLNHKYKELEITTDVEVFLKLCGKPITEKLPSHYKNTELAIEIPFQLIVEFLVVNGVLPRGEEIIFRNMW